MTEISCSALPWESAPSPSELAFQPRALESLVANLESLRGMGRGDLLQRILRRVWIALLIFLPKTRRSDFRPARPPFDKGCVCARGGVASPDSQGMGDSLEAKGRNEVVMGPCPGRGSAPASRKAKAASPTWRLPSPRRNSMTVDSDGPPATSWAAARARFLVLKEPFYAADENIRPNVRAYRGSMRTGDSLGSHEMGSLPSYGPCPPPLSRRRRAATQPLPRPRRSGAPSSGRTLVRSASSLMG